MMIIGFVSGMLCISDNAASRVALMAIIVEAGAQGLTGGLELTHKTAIRNINSDANQNFNFPFQFLSLILCRSTRGRVWGLFLSHAGQSSQ